MNTIPSSELVRIALQDVADWANSRDEAAGVRVDKDAELLGENMIEFRGFEKVREVVVVEHGVVLVDGVNS